MTSWHTLLRLSCIFATRLGRIASGILQQSPLAASCQSSELCRRISKCEALCYQLASRSHCSIRIPSSQRVQRCAAIMTSKRRLRKKGRDAECCGTTADVPSTHSRILCRRFIGLFGRSTGPNDALPALHSPPKSRQSPSERQFEDLLGPIVHESSRCHRQPRLDSVLERGPKSDIRELSRDGVADGPRA
jgi:hypothetical protein